MGRRYYVSENETFCFTICKTENGHLAIVKQKKHINFYFIRRAHMRSTFVFHLISLVVGNRMIKITPRDHPDLVLSIEAPKKEGKSIVKLTDIKKDRKMKRSPLAMFEIKDGITEISQGESKICKDTKNEDIIVCKGSDDLYSKWDLVSEDGAIRFQTEHDVCMEVAEDKKKPDNIKLVGKKCNSNTKGQFFDIKFVENENNQDSDESDINNNSKKDQPLEELLPFMLRPTPNRAPAKQRVILYDDEGKKIGSFSGSVNPLLTSSLSPSILPHSNKMALPRSAYRQLPGLNAEGGITLAPSYADYASY